MATSSSSDLERLRRAVQGDTTTPGLATVLPLLQTRHRQEIRREERWSREELVRHPEPRQLIRAMRKPGNLDEHGRPVYTLDERRFVTSDIRENRFVKDAVGSVRAALAEREEPDAVRLLRQLDRAIGQAPFLAEVGPLGPREHELSTALVQDPLYRAVVSIRP
jgi:Domain of unknown function (DUF2357)